MQTLHERIAGDILKNIQQNIWPVGYVIPTEAQLQAQYGVSRSTVRTALLRLVNEGYLVRKKGSGTCVTRPRIEGEASFFLESFAEEMAARGLQVQTEVLELRSLCPGEEICARLGRGPGGEAIKLTRLRYAKDSFEAGPIVLTTSYFPPALDFVLRSDFEQSSLHWVLEQNGIRRRSIRKEITVGTLTAKEGRLLGMDEGSVAMIITSLALDGDNRVVEYTKSCYPVPRNRFVLRINT